MADVEVLEVQDNQVENQENQEDKKPKRGRKAAPKKNYRTIFNNADKCKANPPLDENDVPVEGFREYRLVFMNDTVFKKGQEFYIQARSGDQAGGFLAQNYCHIETAFESKRGPSKKIDENYLRYLKLMHQGGMKEGIEQFLEEHPHYSPIDLKKPLDDLLETYCKKSS